MNRYVYPYQCEDCGKRFPRKDQLGRHTRRTHPTERVQCRWCHYSQPVTDAYRVRKHELIHQKHLNFEPMATPSYTSSQVASVVQVPDIDDSCRQLMLELDASMPDFADLLGTDPRTPVRRWPQEPQARPVTAQALDLTSSQAIASIQVSRAAMTSGTPGQTNVPVTSSAINAPMDLRRKERVSNETAFQDEPLDLSVMGRPTTRVIPSQSFTNVIDCTTTISRGSWNPTSIEVDPRDKSNNHMCHDPRWFFAGAPSSQYPSGESQPLQKEPKVSIPEALDPCWC